MESRITELPNYLRVEIGTGGASDVMEAYRSAALIALRKGLRRVLVLSLDYQADEVHQAIRSTVRAIALAGGAPGLRIAMVARCPITQEIYGDTAALGQALGLEVRHYETESSAIAWLEEA